MIKRYVLLKTLIIIELLFLMSMVFNLSSAENPENNIIYTDQELEKYKPPVLSKKEPENYTNTQSDNQPNEQPGVRPMVPALGYPSGVPVKPQSAVFKPVLKNPIVPLVKASVIDVSAELRGKSP